MILPSSRTKRYLTGMDWMIHALDYSSRKKISCGTAFQIVMEIGSGLNSADLRKYLAEYCEGFPHLTGKVSRDWNLAPYWKPHPSGQPVQLKVISILNSDQAFRCLETELNQPVEDYEFSLRAVYVESPQKKLIGFIFDHRLFDARGAEKFLHGFQIFYSSGGKSCGMDLPVFSAHLDKWSEKFAAGKKVNRARIAQGKDTQVRLLKNPATYKNVLNRFKIKTFDEKETRAISERAGPFMFLPYSLAGSIQAMDALFLGRSDAQGDLAVSVTRDMRSARAGESADMFFNHLSFMFFRAKAAETGSFDGLLAVLKNQFYEQVKNKMPEALADAGMLMRILPLAVISRGFQDRAHAPASFSFASLGECAYQHKSFMDANVEKMFHMPRMPPLPGLGVFFSEYKKQLSVTLSYLDNLISETEANSVMERLSRL